MATQCEVNIFLEILFLASAIVDSPKSKFLLFFTHFLTSLFLYSKFKFKFISSPLSTDCMPRYIY